MGPETASGYTWSCPSCSRRVPRSVNACRCGYRLPTATVAVETETPPPQSTSRYGSVTITWDDLEAAVAAEIVTDAQADRLWQSFAARASSRPRFDVAHVAYYGGAVLVLAAMGWLLTNAWDALDGVAVALIAAAYGVAFWRAGETLWQKGLSTPGGLLFTLAVWMVPLAIHGLERATGLWPQGDPGGYQDYYRYVKGSWAAMEVGTVAAGALAIWWRPFPFLTFPIAFALWFMSMDLTPIIFGKYEYTWKEREWVSVWFGLAMMLGAYWGDLRARLRQDFAFWGYLFGLLAFWGSLSIMNSNSEASKFIYALINIGLIALSLLLRQRSFIVFGALGVLGYLAHLSYRVFSDSLLFPVVLTMGGIGIIYLGVVYQRRSAAIAAYVQANVPEGVRGLIPPRARLH
ncbi:MAG: hypothetical protein WBC51_00355 [Vicinamibacterales bacterium]